LEYLNLYIEIFGAQDPSLNTKSMYVSYIHIYQIDI
jgi:hypothetical protein